MHGDVLDIFPANADDTAIRVEFFGDEIDRIVEVDVLTGEVKCSLEHTMIFPASHYVVSQEKINEACLNIEKELDERVKYFKGEDKLIEAQRIAERTNFDIEMMRETGFCSGIENYTRHLNFAKPGEPPMTLIDFFPDDFLIIVDESHITIPQIGGMYAGDRSRKTTLVDYGFRLPSALDNRPLNFEEFEGKIDQMLFVSATPNKYENEHELLRAEQIIRPTGLLDPEISVRPVEGQIDDLVSEVNKETANHHQVLITTLTKRMAEDLTNYMAELGIRVTVSYTHLDKDKMNSEVGFCRKALQAFEENGISIEHMPSGIDTMTVFVHQAEFEGKEQQVISSIRRLAHPDIIDLESDLALIAVVGRGMKSNRGTAGRIFSALAHANINVRMIDQGSSELNIIIGVSNDDFDKAIKAIYDIFVVTQL